MKHWDVDAAKTVLERKFIALNAYVKKEKGPKLMLYPSSLRSWKKKSTLNPKYRKGNNKHRGRNQWNWKWTNSRKSQWNQWNQKLLLGKD